MRVGRGFDIEQALTDPLLLGAALGDISSWKVWISVLRAAFGLPLDREQRAVFSSVADGRPPPTHRVEELWIVAGRRSGKSRMAAAIAVYLALFGKHKTLARGEIGYVLCLGQTRDQASLVLNYCEAFLQSSPILKQEIVSTTQDEIRLRRNITIAVHSNSFRSVRGRTLLAVVADEIAYWAADDSANPDVEVYRSVHPSLLASGGCLVAISSPYRRTGLLHQRHRDFYGSDSPQVLVVSGSSIKFNPTLSAAAIDRALASDPEANRAEWEASFRTDLAQFLADELIDQAIDHSRPLELPPRRGVKYFAFCDASAGRHGAFTLCVAHREHDRVICDVLRGAKPPFDPQHIVQDFSQLAQDYGLKQVSGDNFSGDWVVSAFADGGLKYVRAALPKSQLYLEALPLFTRGLIAIPNLPPLVRELRLLERQTHRSGRDTIDAGKHGTDDYANALCGCAAILGQRPAYNSNLEWVFGASTTDTRSWNQKQLARYVASGGYTAPMLRRF
jgi:hypothetical protein